MKKIYIIGPVGSGKTTLAKKLSNQLGIPHYELDTIRYDDVHGHVKRSAFEIQTLFQEIMNQENWIIEDVGRPCFQEGVKQADIIYYIALSKSCLYIRILKRWCKQVLHLELCSYKPTIAGLIEMYKWCHQDLQNRTAKLTELQENGNVIILKKQQEIQKILKK